MSRVGFDVANADEYRDWASQQIDFRTRDRMLDEADRIDRRESERSGGSVIQITINLGGTQ